MRFEQVERTAQEYIDTRYRDQAGQERSDQLLRLRTALYATARPESRARALKVSARSGGIRELKTDAGIKLDVAILSRKEFTIAFRFLRHLDRSGNVINATKWTPDDVPWFLTRLNWTFGAQANIFFTLVDATWITVQKPLEPRISRDVFRRDIVPFKSRGADLTCFLVGDYDAKDNEAAGEYLPDEQVCVVVDRGNPPMFEEGEAFIGVMAHEVGHFLHDKRNPGADTMTVTVSCFPAAGRACPWTSSSSSTSTHGESVSPRHLFRHVFCLIQSFGPISVAAARWCVGPGLTRKKQCARILHAPADPGGRRLALRVGGEAAIEIAVRAGHAPGIFHRAGLFRPEDAKSRDAERECEHSCYPHVPSPLRTPPVVRWLHDPVRPRACSSRQASSDMMTEPRSGCPIPDHRSSGFQMRRS